MFFGDFGFKVCVFVDEFVIGFVLIGFEMCNDFFFLGLIESNCFEDYVFIVDFCDFVFYYF